MRYDLWAPGRSGWSRSSCTGAQAPGGGRNPPDMPTKSPKHPKKQKGT